MTTNYSLEERTAIGKFCDGIRTVFLQLSEWNGREFDSHDLAREVLIGLRRDIAITSLAMDDVMKYFPELKSVLSEADILTRQLMMVANDAVMAFDINFDKDKDMDGALIYAQERIDLMWEQYGDRCGRIAAKFSIDLEELRKKSAVEETPSERTETERFSLVPGGFMLGDTIFNLSGRPMRFLEAIHGSRLRRMGIDDLIESMNVTDDDPDSPQDIVKEAARDARAALKKAVKQIGIDCDEPLPSNGRGGDLTYELKLK